MTLSDLRDLLSLLAIPVLVLLCLTVPVLGLVIIPSLVKDEWVATYLVFGLWASSIIIPLLYVALLRED